MPILSEFCVFAVIVTDDNSVGKKILKSGKPYYLYDGYAVEDLSITYTSSQGGMVALYDDYVRGNQFRYTGEPGLHVSVSAIVGMNGSGKSSIVEFMLRLINNFAASIIGTNPLDRTGILHYIAGVHGELYFLIGGIPHMMSVEGNRVEIYTYETRVETADTIVFSRSAKPVFHRDVDPEALTVWKGKKNVIEMMLKHFFYTFVSNYSIYAYNVNDFVDEWNCAPRSHEVSCWLEGIFHKNDSYQTPVVLTPARDKGCIDINVENSLAVERLLGLLVHYDGYSRVNHHLTVVGFEITKGWKNYDFSHVNNVCRLQLRPRAFRVLRGLIAECWKQKYLFKIHEGLQFMSAALDYLAYKTLKIAAKYPAYKAYYDKLKNIRKWVGEEERVTLKALVEDLSRDHSHVTTRLRQTLCYLMTGAYGTGNFSLEKMRNIAKGAMRSMRYEYRERLSMAFTKDTDVLPAPFFNVKIMVKGDDGKQFAFNQLSSGERQEIHAVSSLLYHLANIDSVHRCNSPECVNRVAYSRVNVILEEIELYYHPHFQRQFVERLLDGLRQMHFIGIEAVSFIIVTHSPFVLSDIPTTNILALENGQPGSLKVKSFGANIHDMLNTAFFMQEGSRGKFAEWFIARIVSDLQWHEEKKKGHQVDDNFEHCYSDRLHQMIMIIDEPIIRDILLEQYHRVFGDDDRQKRITELKKQLSELENE